MTYWGWLLVGIALLLTALSGTQTSLCQRMRSVPVYRGLTYWEVQQIAKAAPTSITPCGEDTIRRWVSNVFCAQMCFVSGKEKTWNLDVRLSKLWVLCCQTG